MKQKSIKVLFAVLCAMILIPFFSFKSYCVNIRNFNQNNPYFIQISQMRNSFAPATVMFFSNSGSDNNDGLSPASPKQNPAPFIAAGNCQCLLKSGDVFNIRETINVGANVIVSTYGGGSRSGLSFIQTSADQFQLYDPENCIYTVSIDACDNDMGWISIDGVINWKRVLSLSLNNDNEYYYDREAHILYVKSTADLTGKNVRYAYGGNGLYIIHGQNVVLENIEIAGAGRHGISIISESNVLVNNCYIHDIGGSIHQSSGCKYGNGIQIWATICNNIAIYKSIVSDCFDAGITPQIDKTQKGNSSNLLFANNLIERCNYGFESFHSSATYTMQNVVVSNNIFYDIKDVTAGYRLNQSSTDYTAFFCLWDYDNTNSSILIDHNFAYKSQVSAISYSKKSNIVPPITFTNNTMVTSNDPIKNPIHYTGDDTQYLVLQQDSADFKRCEKLAKNLISRYSQKKLIN